MRANSRWLLTLSAWLFGTALAAGPARADVTPAPVVADGMVLQRGMDARLFGSAAPGEKVTVTFRSASASATAGSAGRWLVSLPAGGAGGPYAMSIQGQNRLEFKNVYVGEVWLCSGQSNMEWPVRQSSGTSDITVLPVDEQLRLYRVTSSQGARVPMGWHAATPDQIAPFSGVGYYFGRALRAALNVPVGLIQSAVGGTAIERWTRVEQLHALGLGNDRLRSAQATGSPLPANAGDLHAKMIEPLQPFTIRGVIWYQGESNAGRHADYRAMQTGMVQEWRREWREGNFPFLFVQLARIGTPDNSVGDWPYLREAQRQALSEPNTGMAVCFDVSDGDIHPRDKQSVGERLALIARARVYGEPVEFTGPVLQDARREGSRVILTFNPAAALAARGGAPRDFVVEAGAADFRPAPATLQGNQVIVDVGSVTGPVRVLYGWKAYPRGNLYNEAGLPASPFATGLLP
jgi:sialate O-acetylesterase